MPPALKRAFSSTENIESLSEDESTQDEPRKPTKSRRIRKPIDEEELDDENDSDFDYSSMAVDDKENNTSQVDSFILTPSGERVSISPCGTIARVEMKDFMCHDYLIIDLGPKINFVIGHNGSGKSAIMTALTVALGAKASATNRGKNLGSLIREGTNACEITIHITNRGPDAYRYEIYGDMIIVQRKILQDGTGHYKLKGVKSNKVISNKREELTAICDHMSIQVDNPLTVLSQDNAREFLNSSSSKEKYKLFMRGTQLSALADDYREIQEKLSTTEATVNRKRRGLPDLQKRADDAKLRYDEALELDKLETQLEKLNAEQAWCQIVGKEREYAAAQKDMEATERQVKQAKEKLTGAKRKVDHFDEEKNAAQAEADEYHATVSLNTEGKRQEQQAKNAAEAKREDIQADIKELNNLVKHTKDNVMKIKREIATETAKQEASTQAVKDARQAKLDTLNGEVTERGEKLQEYRTQIGDLEVVMGEQTASRGKYAQRFADMEQKKKRLNQRIQDLRGQKSDRLRAFGKNIPEVIRDIQRETRWRKQPVGPLGRYLKLKHMEFSETMEIVLGKFLNAFLVENHDDRRLMSAILERNHMAGTLVLVARQDMFDYSSGEPDEKYLTMLRALEFQDEWVKRQLIIGRGIEQIILVANRKEADRIMENGGPYNVKSCYTTNAKVSGHRGKRTDVLDPYRGPLRFKLDVEPEIREAEEELIKIDREYAELKRERQQLEEKLGRSRMSIKQAQSAVYNLESEIRRKNIEIRQVEESMKEEEPVSLQLLNDKKEDLESRLQGYIGQFSDLRTQDNAYRAEIQEILVRIQKYEAEEAAHEEKMREFQRIINSIETMRQKALRHVASYQDSLENALSRNDEKQRHATLLERTLKEWTAQVMEAFPERVETRRTREQIDKSIRHLEIRIEERNKAIGASVEEIMEEVRDALQTYNIAKDTIGLIDNYKKTLRDTINARIDRWRDLRMYISVYATGHFTYHMHKRGYNGYLKFDHEKERLNVRVSTNDQLQKGTRHKDSKTLSGGEKSFSQISLLLSLWQGISSPLYCLDEFDVYMDAVNRKQSMRMMMDAALSNNAQYIFITPQDASNMVPGPHIRVHRMNDPERHHPPT